MEELRRIFTSAGCKNAAPLFRAVTRFSAQRQRIRQRLIGRSSGAGKRVGLFGLSHFENAQEPPSDGEPQFLQAVRDIVRCNALRDLFHERDAKTEAAIHFRNSEPQNQEVFEVKDGAAFVVARRKKNGWFGFPNAVVEKQLSATATTRQWSTVQKIVRAAETN